MEMKTRKSNELKIILSRQTVRKLNYKMGISTRISVFEGFALFCTSNQNRLAQALSTGKSGRLVLVFGLQISENECGRI